MKVLSLFDGISCGMVALERAGIDVEVYHAYEIEEKAKTISAANYPDIVHFGDVRQCIGLDYDKENFDLLIGGSPCQDLSQANVKGKGLSGQKSSLFFEYLRIKDEMNPRYFLYENVASMKKEDKDIISDYLDVEPIMIDSALVSGQSRKRLYWTNIPNVVQPKDLNIFMKDIISSERKWTPNLPWSQKIWGTKRKVDMLRTIDSEKSFCLTTNKTHPKNYYLNTDRTMMSKLNANEAEKLQTLPSGYTDHVAETHRFKHIGNGWTVDVIAHIFKGLT